jgi:small conductance mechanosensitive channel
MISFFHEDFKSYQDGRKASGGCTCGFWRPEVMDMDVTMDLQKAATQVVKKLDEWGLNAVKMLPNLLVAIIVLILFWLMAFVVDRMVRRMVSRISPYGHMVNLIAQMSRLIVIAGGVILALSAMSLDRMVASMLAGVGILSIALGFASKDIAGDYMAGFIIHFTHPFRSGHIIQVGKFFGYVDSIEMRATTCHTQQGQRVIIPNRKIVEGEVINYSVTGVRRVDLICGVSYGDDLQQVEDLAIKAVESLEMRNPDRPVELFYEEFGASSINFKLRFWTQPEQKTYLKARSEAIKVIIQTFKDHGITIPFPIRTLDFGTGGVSLKEQLEGLSIPLSLEPQVQPGEKERPKPGGKEAEKQEESMAGGEKNGGEPDSRE